MDGPGGSTSARIRLVLRACLMPLVVTLALCSLSFSLAIAEEQPDALKPVSIGFLRHAYGTWTSKIADGGYERAAGKSVRWIPFDTDSAVAAALASGKIDIGMMGASVVAAAVTRGLDLHAFYVMGWSLDTEALVVSSAFKFKPSDPKGLINKVVAVPFGSTAHFRLLQSLKRWGVAPSDVRLVNLQPQQIVEAWAHAELDAAVVSEPTLSELRVGSHSVPFPRASGKEGLLVFATGSEFLQRNAAMLARFVDVTARADTVFSEGDGPVTTDRPEIRSIAFLTGLPAEAVLESIARYRPPPIQDQASERWLRGGAASGLAMELKSSAELWKWGGRLDKVNPDYAGAVALPPVEQALSMP